MQYRQLGRSGVRVSAIGIGTNRFGMKVDQAEVNRIIDAALDLGVTFIDTANVYGDGKSEEALGVALAGKRDCFIVATKFRFDMGDGPNDQGASRYHILNAIEDSLHRLKTDHIDLYQIHRWDPDTPIEETLRTLDDLISAGKVRYIGASQFAAWQLAKANLLAEIHHREPFVTVQLHYHLLERHVEHELIPYSTEHGVGLIPFYPLAGGFLTGKYREGQPAPVGSRGEDSAYVQGYMTPANYASLDKLIEWAEAHDHLMVDLAQAWLLAQPGVCSVISGVTRVEQLEQNVQAAEWTLTAEEAAEVTAILDAK